MFLLSGTYALSIALLLMFGVFVQFIQMSLKPLNAYTPDISLVVNPQQYDEGLKGFQKKDSIVNVYGRRSCVVKTKLGKEVNVISYDEVQIEWGQELLLKGASILDWPKGIWIGKTSSLGNLGDIVEVFESNKLIEMKIAGVLTETPFDRSNRETIICTENFFKECFGEGDDLILDLQIKSSFMLKPINEIVSINSYLDIKDYRKTNFEAMLAFYSIAFFVYGFSSVLIFITVLNILNSIKLNYIYHIKENAQMRAIGITQVQLIKIFAVENISYNLVGGIIGIIIGVLLNRWLFNSLTQFYSGNMLWEIPYKEIIICVLITILSILFGLKYPIRRIKEMNIIESMGKGNV